MQPIWTWSQRSGSVTLLSLCKLPLKKSCHSARRADFIAFPRFLRNKREKIKVAISQDKSLKMKNPLPLFLTSDKRLKWAKNNLILWFSEFSGFVVCLLIFWILILKVFSFSVNSACDLFCSGYGCGTQKVLPRLIVKLSTLFKSGRLRKCMWHFSRKITHYFPERKHCTR